MDFTHVTIPWQGIAVAIGSILLLMAMTSYYARKITSLRSENGDLKKKVNELSAKTIIAPAAPPQQVPLIESYTRFASAAGPVLLAAFAFGTLWLNYVEKQNASTDEKHKWDSMQTSIDKLLGPNELDELLKLSITRIGTDQELGRLTTAEKKALLQLGNSSITDALSSQSLTIRVLNSPSRIIVIPMPHK
jgi:hypothetical protein